MFYKTHLYTSDPPCVTVLTWHETSSRDKDSDEATQNAKVMKSVMYLISNREWFMMFKVNFGFVLAECRVNIPV